MADKKITALTATTSVVAADVIPVVTDTTGTPTTKKVTASNLAASIAVIGLNAGVGVRTAIHGIQLPVAHTIAFEGATDDAYDTILTVVDPTANRTITLPNATGTVALTSDLSSYATLASPTFTGTPLSTTAAVDTNTTQVATTAYVVGQAYAKLASPTLTGTPLAPTATAGTSTTQIATTAFADPTGDQYVLAAAVFNS